MPIEIEKIHRNLEGHSVLVIESYQIAKQLADRLGEIERMRVITGARPCGENGKVLSLSEWVRCKGAEAVIIHPHNCGSNIEEIIRLHNDGCRVLVIGGNEGVEEGRRRAYKKLELNDIPMVTKDLLNRANGYKIFTSSLLDELSTLFKK